MQRELLQGLPECLERHFAKLSTIGNEADGSISRIAYSDAESTAMAYIRAEGEALGLVGHYDGIGNLLLSTPDGHARRLLVGSHIDSVPFGGNYEGAAGVVAALEATREIVERGGTFAAGIDIVVWWGEEYSFGAAYKGSATAFGKSEPHILRNIFDDRSLRDAILQQGFDPSYIDECRASFAPGYVDAIVAYLELHIEQGQRLEQERLDLGAVTQIAGDRRFLVVVEGRFDHSGATPMGTKFRSDVNLAIARIQTRLDELGKKRREEGHEFVQTVGIVNADPEIDKKYPRVHGNALTKVSGLGYFTLDIMSADDVFMDQYAAEVLRLIWQVAKEQGTKAIVEQTDAAAGVLQLDANIQRAWEKHATALGHTIMPMASGAGHDAVVVAKTARSDGSHIPVGMLFVPCREGISHAKEEFVAAEQIAKGVEVLREVMAELIGG